MILVYVAGPYRAKTQWQVDRNIQAAREVGAHILEAGAYPLIPHSNTAHMDGAATDEVFLAGTMEMMCRSDGVVFLPGWEDSEGSKVERFEAKLAKIPIHDWHPGRLHGLGLHAFVRSLNRRLP